MNTERKGGSPLPGAVTVLVLIAIIWIWIIANPAVLGRELRGLGDDIGPWFSAVQQAGWGR